MAQTFGQQPVVIRRVPLQHSKAQVSNEHWWFEGQKLNGQSQAMPTGSKASDLNVPIPACPHWTSHPGPQTQTWVCSGLQVDISTALESLSIQPRQPRWKASHTGIQPRHGPCHRGSSTVRAGLRVLPDMGAAISQGALIAIVCNGLVGLLLLLLWVILCWACHSRSADIDSLSESSPNSSPGPCPEKAPPPQKPSHEGSYLLQP
ncbi:Adropin [Tupaia chinensis]|uniref:Adropin n=2 Tax=Tupaia chinensis TaxID=246437 RepID=L9L5C8_TUPCH|nr:Adropin [Tupaia chinensis]